MSKQAPKVDGSQSAIRGAVMPRQEIGSTWSPLGEYFYTSGALVGGRLSISCYRNTSPDDFIHLFVPQRITNEEAIALAEALVRLVEERRAQFAARNSSKVQA